MQSLTGDSTALLGSNAAGFAVLYYPCISSEAEG